MNMWKIRRELCKVYKIYNKKAKSILNSNFIHYHIVEYEQLQDIQYAIVYVLCKYFDFNYKLYYEIPFSYKWLIAYDYIHYYDECKKAYEKFLYKENKDIREQYNPTQNDFMLEMQNIFQYKY